MNKEYRNNPGYYKQNGHRRIGYFTDWADTNYEKENPAEKDNKMRKSIIEEIEIRCKNGELLEDVVNEIAKDEEIKIHFSYLTKRGLKLPEIFKDWYEGKKKNEEKSRNFMNGR